MTVTRADSDAAPSGVVPTLASFARDALDYAALPGDPRARRLLRSPYCGLTRADAAAIIVAAGDRTGAIETIERLAVPLDRASAAAAARFVESLRALDHAYRAQGATALEVLRTIVFRFELDRDAGAHATIAALEAVAVAIDAAASQTGEPWRASDLHAAIDAAFETLRPRVPFAGATTPTASLERYDPEPRHNVKRRRGHFSASALGMYAACERRWYYRYVCAAVEDRGSSASFYGTAFHWALERFHERVKRADAAPPQTLERDLDAWITTAFGRHRSGFEWPVEYELQLRRARRTGKRYIAWFLARYAAAPFEVAGTETEAALDLDGYSFIGYIDRLDRDDRTHAVTVVDYKTGTIAESAKEYRDNVASFIDFQLPFYYWARTAQGDRVTRLALVPLRDATREVEPVELEVVPVAGAAGRFDDPRGTIGIDELQRARAKMIELARRLTDEPIERFAVTRDADTCVYCAYKNACRDRPLAMSDRFGR